MPQNVEQLISLEKSQKQQLLSYECLKVLIICLLIGNYHYKTNEMLTVYISDSQTVCSERFASVPQESLKTFKITKSMSQK